MRKVIAVLVVLILTTAGCASIPKQPFNREANQAIQQITLIEPAIKPDYAVRNLGNPAQSFGLIGLMIAEGQASSKTAAFTKLAKARSFDLKAEFMAALVAELQNAGYKVQTVTAVRPKHEFLPAYGGMPAGTQAILDTTVESGYLCAASDSDYLPTVHATVRLVKPNGKEILYQEAITYGFESRGAEAISIAAEKKYFFEDFDKLSASADLAVEGMRVGIPLVAKQIAQDLRK